MEGEQAAVVWRSKEGSKLIGSREKRKNDGHMKGCDSKTTAYE